MRTPVLTAVAVVTALAGLGSVAAAAGWDEFGEAVDLAAFHEIDPALTDPLPIEAAPQPTVADAVQTERFLRVPARPARRFYVSGLIGSSFATLEDEAHDGLVGGALTGTILTGGLAAGMGFERSNGQLRVEIEGRGRDRLTASYADEPAPGIDDFATFAASDGWSALVNVWRDYSLGERLGAYLGGGIGSGGYTYGLAGGLEFEGEPLEGFAGQSAETTFAWQAGCGVLWNISPRVTFDVGYRFFALEDVNSPVAVSAGGDDFTAFTRNRFTASELLFTLRVYEPFRRWTR